jgi:plastocyanin
VAATLGGACAPSSPPPDIPVSQAEGLLVQVVDSLNDAGRGSSVAIGSDGAPAISYLLLKPVLKQGEIPPPVVAGQAQPPSVMLAAQAEGLWSLTSVTAQAAPGEEAVGSATEIANQDGQAVQGVTTSLAVDPQGAHHVVWSTPKGLFYSNDAGGAFGEAQEIISAPAFGASVGVGDGGSLFVSFYTSTSVRVAERSGSRWNVGASLRNTGPTTPAAVTAIGVGPDGPIVAFGDDGKTMVARRSAPAPGTTAPAGWDLETVGNGGYGMSMDLDQDGNPHVAYYDGQGNVRHAHSIGGGPWEVTDIDSVGAPAKGDSDAGWSTGISLDDEGVHYVTWADTTEKRIEFATNAEGGFEPQAVDSGQGGTNPAIAVSGDGESIVVTWFDSVNANLKVAQTPSGELVLAHPTERPAAPPGAPPAAECEPEGGTALQIAAPAGASTTGFDKDCLAVEPGAAFTVEFSNGDDAIPHNWTLYTDSSATERLGGSQGVQDPTTGGQTSIYDVDPLDAGTYFFRCDFHPGTMTGAFAVPEG